MASRLPPGRRGAAARARAARALPPRRAGGGRWRWLHRCVLAGRKARPWSRSRRGGVHSWGDLAGGGDFSLDRGEDLLHCIESALVAQAALELEPHALAVEV